MFQIFAVFTLGALVPSFVLMLSAPKSLFLLIPLVVIGIIFLFGGIALYQKIMKHPLTGAGAVSGNAWLLLFGIFVGWLGLMFLINAAILGWRIFG